MDIRKELIDNPVLLSVLSKEHYSDSILHTIKSLKGKNICYVTLNKTSSSLINAFKYKKVDVDNIFFIDAVSQSLGADKGIDNAIFVSSPAALTELSIAISEAVKSKSFDILLFDSLSTLSIYGSDNISKFTSSVINQVKSQNSNGVFTCLEEDIKVEPVRSSFMHVDKVVKFKEFYESLEKKKQNKTFTALAVLVAIFTSVGLFNFFPSYGVTAFNVMDTTGLKPGWTFLNTVFIGLLALFVVTLALAYRSIFIQEVPKKNLAAMKPAGSINKKKVKARFSRAIRSWQKKR